MHVPALPRPPGFGLGEKARPQAHRRRHLLDGELYESGLVGCLQAPPGRDVQLEQAGPRLAVDGDELDAQPVEGRPQSFDEVVEASDLGEAVADPT